VSATPLRVVVCTQGFPRHAADHHAAFVLDHARALVAAGATVDVVCPSAPGLARRETVPAGEGPAVAVHRFRYAPRRWETLAYTGAMHHRARGAAALLLPAFAAGFLVGVLRRARHADVLHAHWWLPSGIVAVLAGRIARVPVVVHVHGTDAAMGDHRLLRPLARLVLRAADAVVAASDDLAGWASRVAGVDAVVLPMPLRAAYAGPGAERPGPADPAGPVLGVGRLVPEKGFDVLVRAAALAGLPLVLVGDGPERSRLAALAEEVGADLRFAGAVPPAELAEHYRAARLVAVPSRREGFGLVAAEALASGRAVVASAVGGLTQVVHDGVDGRLVPPDDVDALAAALATTDPGLGAAGPAGVAWLAPARIGAETLALHHRVVGTSTGTSVPNLDEEHPPAHPGE